MLYNYELVIVNYENTAMLWAEGKAAVACFVGAGLHYR